MLGCGSSDVCKVPVSVGIAWVGWWVGHTRPCPGGRGDSRVQDAPIEGSQVGASGGGVRSCLWSGIRY